MQKKLTILFHQDKATVDWAIHDPYGELQSSMTDGELAELNPPENAIIIAIIPGVEVLLTACKLPKLSASRLRQALPYALEDQLLDEPEALHFAPGPYQPEQDLPLAVIKKSVLEHYLAQLRQHALHPDILVPTTLALPCEENQWMISRIGDSISVRTGLYAGFSCEPSNLDLLLSLKQTEEKQAPENIKTCHMGKEDTPLTFIPDISNKPFINLLQPPYAPPDKLYFLPQNKKAWKYAALAFLISLCPVLLTPLVSSILLSHEQHNLQNRLAHIYDRYQVNLSAPDARAQLEVKLRKKLKENNRTVFLQWLAKLSKAGTSIRIEHLNFQNQMLDLELTAPSFNSLTEFIHSLESQDTRVLRQTATLAGTQVKANILIARSPTWKN